jgi:hypothetical protein
LLSSSLPAAELRDLMILLSLSNSPLIAAMASEVDREQRRTTILATARAVLNV